MRQYLRWLISSGPRTTNKMVAQCLMRTSEGPDRQACCTEGVMADHDSSKLVGRHLAPACVSNGPGRASAYVGVRAGGRRRLLRRRRSRRSRSCGRPPPPGSDGLSVFCRSAPRGAPSTGFLLGGLALQLCILHLARLTGSGSSLARGVWSVVVIPRALIIAAAAVMHEYAHGRSPLDNS